MATTKSTERAGALGLAFALYWLLDTVLSILGLPEDLERWRSMVGPISFEAFRQLALLAGLLLLTPAITVSLGGWWRKRRERHAVEQRREKEIRQRQDWARSVLPHFGDKEIESLRELLEGPRPVDNSPPSGFAEVIHSGYSEPTVYELNPILRAPVEEFFQEQERNGRLPRLKISAIYQGSRGGICIGDRAPMGETGPRLPTQ